MRGLLVWLSCAAALVGASPLRAQTYGPNVSVAAGQLHAFPGQTMTGTLRWWGRQTPIYAQTDPRWAQRPMGRSGETVSQLGCFVAAAAMARNLLGYSTTIRQMLVLAGRDATFRRRGYVSSKEILGGLFPGHAVRFVTQDGFEALEHDGDELIILRIDQTPDAAAREWHWVLLLGQAGTDFLVVDPIDGGVRRLRDAAHCGADYSRQDLCKPIHGGYVIDVARGAAPPSGLAPPRS